MRLDHLARLAALALLAAVPARAQDAPAPPADTFDKPLPMKMGPPETVVARVGGSEIRLQDVQDLAGQMPAEMRQMPPQVVFGMLLDQAIDRQALAVQARKAGVEKDPVVQHQIARVTDQVLGNAVLTRAVGPLITEQALRARFDAAQADRKPEEEVHARHILVADETLAKKLTADVKAGADFAELAKKNSTDPGGASGGDLGFFKRADMLPEFSDAAFKLAPGQITDAPVKTRYGWHVIKLEEKRTSPAPTFEQERDGIRQQVIQGGVQKALEAARVGLTIKRFNADGTPATAPLAAPDAPAADAPK